MNNYVFIYYDDDFSIGYWKGTKDFQWNHFDYGCDIFHYNREDIENLHNVINKYTNITDEEFDKICDEIARVNNINSYGPYIIIYKDTDDKEIWCSLDGSQIEWNKGDGGREIYIESIQELEEEYEYLKSQCDLTDEQETLLFEYLNKNFELHKK